VLYITRMSNYDFRAELGRILRDWSLSTEASGPLFDDLAAIVIKADKEAREACAKICEAEAADSDDSEYRGAMSCAEAIRASVPI
jgi:hypothetical protein